MKYCVSWVKGYESYVKCCLNYVQGGVQCCISSEKSILKGAVLKMFHFSNFFFAEKHFFQSKLLGSVDIENFP